ncbi:Serine/threonine-protein kinase rio1, partial [Oleoguttula sp. CCFEE 5521]
MSPSAIDPAAAHEPPHRFVENEGYVALPVQASTTDATHERSEETNAEDDPGQDEDFDDLFEPSDDGYSDTELQASNPSDYTKAYNRQRRNNDNTVPESHKPKANPQLNTRAAVDDHIKSLSAHTAKLKLSNTEAGLGGKGHGGAEKSDRATSEQVLDPRTRMILLQMLNRNIVSEINGVISTGKEANVYHSTTVPQSVDDATPLHRAIKVYKTSILVFKDRDKYVSGEHRFKQGYNKSSNRAKVKVWAEKEYRNLRRLHAAGIPCPEPLYLKAHVLVMSFLGSGKGVAAPRLRDVQFEEDSSDLVAQRWREV